MTRRIIPFLMVVCSFRAPADAQYSGGSGTADDPYQIATAADLIALGETPDDHDKHFILTAEIDLDPNFPGGRIFDRAVIAPDTNDVTSGFRGESFTGVFDGNRHVISHLKIAGDSYLGLFGWLDSDAIILNLGLGTISVNGIGDYVGGLVARNDGCIARSYSVGTVSGGRHVGGLVGTNEGGSITICYSIATVDETDNGTEDIWWILEGQDYPRLWWERGEEAPL